MPKNNTNLVFTRVFNFLGLKLALTHALFHSCQPLLDFLKKLMHLCRFTCARFTKNI